MFAGKGVKHLSGAPIWGRLMVSTSNIRQGLRGTNTPVYYENRNITAVKSLMYRPQEVEIIH
jgi:hypothetical protein